MMDAEDKRIATGVDEPVLIDAGAEVGCRKPSRVFAHGAVADDLDNQFRRTFQLDESILIPCRFGNEPHASGKSP